jgi:hypothetical protein
MTCLAVRADDRVAAVTNRLCEIVATSNYTFGITFGRQGALTIEGYSAGMSGAFRASLAGREMLRASDKQIWLAAAGTDTAVTVAFDFPLRVVMRYAANYSATMTLGLLPPTGVGSFVMANYDGLAGRIAALPSARKLEGGWQFCETNETGTCIEIGEHASPSRVNIALLKTQADKSSVFIHELRMAAGAPAHEIVLPAPKRTVHLHDFAVALTFCTSIAEGLSRAAAQDGSAADVFQQFGRNIDHAGMGLGTLPPLPPLPARR